MKTVDNRHILTVLFLTLALGAVTASADAAVPPPRSTPDVVRQWWGLSSVSDGTGTLNNSNRGADSALTWTHETFGVDLGWKSPPALWRVQGRHPGALVRGEPVALRVWGGGWLRYGHQTWGVDLQLSETPSYEWYAVGGTSGAPLADGSYFGLWNSTAHDYLVSGHQTFGVDLDWRNKTLPPAPNGRSISVAKQGTGSSTVLVISGVGFTPNALVVMRVSTAPFQTGQFVETTGFDGRFVSPHSVPCVSGRQLTIDAFEDRDPTNTFSNVIVTNCP